jgi:hypothetical protein
VKPLGVGLAVALMLAALVPMAASAAPAGVTKEQREKGMAAAPGLVSAAGLDCQVADARMIGEGTDPKTKQKIQLFELVCTGNLGLLIQRSGAANPPTAFTCIQANEPRSDGKPNPVQCALPGNSDPKAGLTPYIAKANIVCAPDKVRALGESATQAVFELTCHEPNGGYVLQISNPPRLDKPVVASPCVAFSDTSTIKCTLTDRAAQLAVVDSLVAQSGKPCTVKDRAYIGTTTNGKTYFEVACQNGNGYILEQAVGGGFGRAVNCADADAIAGGCKLTDARASQTEQAGLYTTLAKKAGFPCEVSRYAPLPGSADTRNMEVVELACSNRPDGAVAMFGATASEPAFIYDCVNAELLGYRCSLSKAAAAYPKLTADLRALGKTSCVVSNARTVGVTADKHGYVEVGCSDGLPGYVIEYTLAPLTPKTPIVCAEAKGISGGCTLPGNVKKS